MKNMMRLTIEDDVELLKRYGLAMALCNSVDYMLGEYIRLEGGLHNANQEIVNALMDEKTFGRKIKLANKLISDETLKAELSKSLEDRNLLAHGVSGDQDGQKILMFNKGSHPLTVESLDAIIGRARELSGGIFKEIQKRFKLDG